MVSQIPFELTQLDQWVVASFNKNPVNPRTGHEAKVNDPSTWGSFEEAQRCGYPHIGFVLAKDDPYTIIDLDDPKYISKDQLDPDPANVARKAERHRKILDAFDTYAELSQSGNGVHIICRGGVAHGARRDRVEIYSDGRYMICTGNIIKPRPISDCQELLAMLWQEVAADALPSTELHQIDGAISDERIWSIATAAANSAKFSALWAGQWQGQPEYPSQSEADFALLSMLAFYSKDNAQVRRLFRHSELGKRDKAMRNDTYINFALRKIRAKQLPPIDFSQLLRAHETPASETPTPHEQGATASPPQGAPAGPTGASEDVPEIDGGLRDDEAGDALAFPPGFIGEVAQYILDSAIRPVPEIALAAALALTAGVIGRAFNISGSGLNQYIIVLARTGSGKEGAAKGIDALISAVRQQIPMADDFIGPSAFASGQALIRVLDKQPCFVSVLGEFGLTLQQLCDPRANSAQLILKKVLLDIYAKSGFNSTLRSSVYSEQEKNTKIVQAPNVTILGESTPEAFYDVLDGGSIAQGLLPRFSLFEYTGKRPGRNAAAFKLPDKALVDRFAYLMHCAIAAHQNRVFCPVLMEGEAETLLDAFDEKATAEINRSGSDVTNQLWNRAHLKALKLAALVAAGINANAPVIGVAAATWAIHVVERDVRKLLGHFQAGEIGQGDHRLEADLRRAVMDYFRMSPKTRKGYAVPSKIIEHPIICLAYLRRRLTHCASFKADRRGANAAIVATLKAMVESGSLVQVSPVQAATDFKTTVPLWCVGESWAAGKD